MDHLYSYRSQITPEMVKFYAAQIIVLFEHLHSKNLCYYFLFPENIMLDNKGNIKLKYDYCNLCGLSGAQFNKNVEYVPIDYLKYKRQSWKSDYWQLGIFIYELIFGVSPFKGGCMNETVENIIRRSINVEDVVLNDLFRVLLDKHEFRRVNVNLRRHRYFEGVDWGMIENRRVDGPILPVLKVECGREADEEFRNYFWRKDSDGYGDRFRGYEGVERGVLGYYMDLE